MDPTDREIRRVATLLPNALKSIREYERTQDALLNRFASIIEAASAQVERTEQSNEVLRLAVPQLEALRVLETRWQKNVASAFEKLRSNGLPPNLRSIYEDVNLQDVLTFVEEEGIPLYLVPRASIGRRLLRAKDQSTRRKILNSDFEKIVADCSVVIEQCTSSVTSSAKPFVEAGLVAIRSGQYAAAQALLTNVLDTLTQQTLSHSERGTILSHKQGKGPQTMDLQLREDYVFLPLWKSYGSYWPEKGDPIPSVYSRHASAHGVSARQYSKRNTAQVLMLVASYMGFVNGL